MISHRTILDDDSCGQSFCPVQRHDGDTINGLRGYQRD